jgi:UDP-N-acetylmuramoyl-L-alanyl-D-glutamate--2,6-diaminopimelate ligase
VSTLVFSRNGIPLTDILPKAKLLGAKEVYVQSCCGHWNDCEANDLFVAIVGPESDGHEWAHEAVKRGAAAIVTERLLTVDRPQCLVPDSRAAYGRICQALAGSPSQKLTAIGISGTDGKTVTSHLIRQILNQAGLTSGITSSIEVNLGMQRHSIPSKPLTSPMLADQLTQMAMAGCQHAIVEVSSIELAQRVVEGVEFDIAVLTNIRRDHLDFHGSSDNYRRVQLRLLKYLKSAGMAVLNADDPTTHFLLEQLETPCLTFGIKQEAQLTAKILERSRTGQTFMLQAGCESVPVYTRIIGDQHVYNCLAAAAVGLARGIELTDIATALAGLTVIPGRLEPVECGQDYGVWIDSARSASQLATAIRSVKQVSAGRVWSVLSTTDLQTESDRKRFGEILDKSKVEAVITRNTIESVNDLESMHQVLDGFENAGKPRIIANRFRAIEWVLSQAQPGDGVLITGCGEKPFALVGNDCWTISDRDVCQAWLYDNGSLIGEPSGKNSQQDIFKIDDYR